MPSSLLLLLVSALELRPTWVDYRAPAECPDRAAFESELAARTDLVRLTEQASDATAKVTVVLKKNGKRYEGSLVVQTADGARTRKTLQGPRCETVTRAMTLTAALVLDPEGAKLELPVPKPVTPPPPEPPEPTPPPPEPTPPPPEPTPPVVKPTPMPTTPVRTWQLEARAVGLLSSAVSGRLDFGGGARVDLSLGAFDQPWRFIVGLGGGALSGQTITATAGSVRYAPHLLAELDVGAGLAWQWLTVRLGVSAQLMPLFVEGLDGDVRTSSQRWLWNLGPVARVGVELSGWLIGVRVVGGVGLRHESYVIEPRGEVFAVPLLGWTAALEVGRAF